MNPRKLSILLGTVLLHGVLYGAAFLTVAPFLWMALTSFKELSEILVYPPKWIPGKFITDNFVSAFQSAPFGRYYFNSIFVAATVTVGQIITCSMAAFAFARLRLRR